MRIIVAAVVVGSWAGGRWRWPQQERNPGSEKLLCEDGSLGQAVTAGDPVLACCIIALSNELVLSRHISIAAVAIICCSQ